ncbi:MAG: TolB family protein [Pyrinomonadaceae bacterium]
MKSQRLILSLIFACFAVAASLSTARSRQSKPTTPGGANIVTPPASERHLKNVRQLTSTGENAEAYFSGDGGRLIFQSKHGAMPCDQIFTMRTDGSEMKLVSTGKGRTTCSYFFPNDKKILYASTHLASADCPPPPDFSRGYVWAIYPGYDIFTARPDGSNLKQLTNAPGYDAEATTSVDGKHIVFTSVRDGDLELYSMDADGTHVRRLTNELGYDGGAFYSRDGRQIVYRGNHPRTEAEVARYKKLLAENLVEPNALELWVMNADGTHKRQVTQLGVASFAPYFLPDGKRIIFSSNYPDIHSRDFNLFVVNTDGTGLEQITTYDGFDGFPMFSPDGRKLVFASNRDGKAKGDTNIFIADWVE